MTAIELHDLLDCIRDEEIDADPTAYLPEPAQPAGHPHRPIVAVPASAQPGLGGFRHLCSVCDLDLGPAIAEQVRNAA